MCRSTRKCLKNVPIHRLWDKLRWLFLKIKKGGSPSSIYGGTLSNQWNLFVTTAYSPAWHQSIISKNDVVLCYHFPETVIISIELEECCNNVCSAPVMYHPYLDPTGTSPSRGELRKKRFSLNCLVLKAYSICNYKIYRRKEKSRCTLDWVQELQWVWPWW